MARKTEGWLSAVRRKEDVVSTAGIVRSLNASKRKGTRKTPIADGIAHVIAHKGLAEDAHAGD